jgi:glutamyl-tRNA synthetase
MDLGNAFVTSRQKSSSGAYETAELALHLAGDFKKTSKKVTWLASIPAEPLVPVSLIEYDYLITKKKLEEHDSLTDVLNPKNEYRVNALASPEVKDLKKWDIIQFERKGFYICQGTKDAEGRMEFGFIPEYVFHLPLDEPLSTASKSHDQGVYERIPRAHAIEARWADKVVAVCRPSLSKPLPPQRPSSPSVHPRGRGARLPPLPPRPRPPPHLPRDRPEEMSRPRCIYPTRRAGLRSPSRPTCSSLTRCSECT